MGTVSSDNQPRPRDGEIRPLTALFCDLVGSSEFAEQLGPEDWDEILSKYHRTCEAVVLRYKGLVAQRLGDGLVAHFGEKDEYGARSAVLAGLSLIEAMRELNGPLERQYRIRLQVRIGIATGDIVRGAAGEGHEERATGATLNIASRLQSVARPDTVVISGDTVNRVDPFFELDDLGWHVLSKNTKPVRAYRVVAPTGAITRLDAVTRRKLTPLVGRQTAVNTLLDAWARAAAGRSQIAFLVGEAGIGKSRLVKVLRQHINHCAEFRCSPYDSHSALFPVLRHIERALHFDQLTSPEEQLDRLEQKTRELGFPVPEVLPLLASQFSLPLPGDPVADITAKQRRQQTLNVLVEWLLKEAERTPLMTVWEDLHWADPSTIELLDLMIARITKTDTPLLALMTFRPDEFQPPWPELAATTDVLLGPLDAPEVEEMIGRLTRDRPLPREVVAQIAERAEGNPLHVEEFVQAVLEAGSVRNEGDRIVEEPPTQPIAIPATLKDSLMSRLDRLGHAKAVAQRAAILGRTFSEDVLRAVLDADARERGVEAEPRQEVDRCLARLVHAGVLHHAPNASTTYEFKHALIRDAAYQLLLKQTRKAYHLQTARVLETQFAHVAETQPELLARHYGEASHADAAFGYWQRAAERARDRSANKEAIHHVGEGLKLLEAMPESETRDRKELVLRIASITPTIAVEGYAAEATARVAERALTICRKLGDVDRLFPVIYTLWANRIVSARYADALHLSDEFLREAAKQQDPAPRLISQRARGISLCMDGNLAGAEACLLDSLALYEPQKHGELKNQGYGQDPRATVEAFMALVSWLRGCSDDAVAYSHRALEHADEARHTNTWGYVRWFGASMLEAFQRDVARSADHTSALITFAEREGLPVWLSFARVLHGWTLAQIGRFDDGIAEMKTGLVNFEGGSATTAAHSLNQGFVKSFLLSLLGEAYATAGRPEEALATLDSALSFAAATGESFWKAELQRLRGEMILRVGGRPSSAAHEEAESCFLRAMEIASAQGALALELRAAMSLNRLWRQQKPAEARELLASVYRGFTQGFDSPDLVNARRLLDDLVVI